MKYNLTPKQQELARWLVAEHEGGRLGEDFTAQSDGWRHKVLFGHKTLPSPASDRRTHMTKLLEVCPSFSLEGLDTIVANGLLLKKGDDSRAQFIFRKGIFDAVHNNFTEEPAAPPLSTLAHAAPPELNLSLDRLRKIYPDPATLGFLIMRFTEGSAFSGIVTAIKETAEEHGIAVVRADEKEFHSDLWGNVRTYLHGCSFGIAVYERIEQEEPNANVGLEVGYLLAMNKPVLLLKERTVKALQADLMGRLYKEFDVHDPAGSIPEQLTKWLTDNGVILSHEK